MTSLLASAQVIIAPLEYNAAQEARYRKGSFKIAALSDTINYPLFDDFSTSSVTPDTSFWIQNGGTYIGNNFAIDPPTYNVATFDGIKADGSPYNSSNINDRGLSDNLTSRPINLFGLKSTDSLYLKFYWQGQGLGEGPDTEDSIRLQFKTKENGWKTMWKQTGDSTDFNLQVIRIGGVPDSTKYYYKGFQFRFESYGKRSGSYDVWNIDYIYLDTALLAKEDWSPDFSYPYEPTPILKNYTAMPIAQWLPYKSQELSDTVSVTIKSLSDKIRPVRIADTISTIRDIKNNITFDSIPTQSMLMFPSINDTAFYKVDKSAIDSTNIQKILKYQFRIPITTYDPGVGVKYDYYTPLDLAGTSRVDFRRNDSISVVANITDYFAYDDGSAEYGIGVNQNGGKIAVKYKINTPDTLTHVSICFPKSRLNQNGEPLRISVWRNITVGQDPETPISNEGTVALKHSTSVNGFTTYKLSTPIELGPTDTEIYVGYQQFVNESIFVGFDKNTYFGDNVYYTVNNKWQQLTTERGSAMIRPVFRDATVLGIDDKKTYNELEAEVYPNPSYGQFYIAGKIETVMLYDLTGKLLLTQQFDGLEYDVHELNIGNLPEGMYLLHLENKDARTVKRISVVK